MRFIIILLSFYCVLIAESPELNDTLLFRGFKKIICINAPEDPVAFIHIIYLVGRLMILITQLC